MALVATSIVAVAVVLSVIVAQASPTTRTGPASVNPSQTGGASASPPASHLTSTWPTIAGSVAAVPSQLDLPHLGFWTIEQPMAAADLSGVHLRVGTLDGHVAATIELHDPGMGLRDMPLRPTPVGPAGRRVLYVVDRGHEAVLRVVSTTTGADRELTRTTGFIARLAIDPAGTTAYYLILERATGAVAGVYGIATDGGEPQTIIGAQDVHPVSAAPFSLVAQASYFPQLAVSMDGRWVVFASCRPTGCDLMAVQANGDAVTHWATFTFKDTIVGIAGDLLIGSSTCQEASCDGFALDLRTGQRWALGGMLSAFDPKQLIVGPRGPVVLGEAEDFEKGRWRVNALRLTDRSQHQVFTGTFKPGYTMVRLADGEAGAELPAGWFLIYRSADAAPAPYPEYSAASLGGRSEAPLAIMAFPKN